MHVRSKPRHVWRLSRHCVVICPAGRYTQPTKIREKLVAKTVKNETVSKSLRTVKYNAQNRVLTTLRSRKLFETLAD